MNVDIEHERYDATSEREDRAQHFDVDGIVIMEAVSVGFEDILGSPLGVASLFQYLDTSLWMLDSSVAELDHVSRYPSCIHKVLSSVC